MSIAPEMIWVVFAAVLYTLVAVRVGFVYRRKTGETCNAIVMGVTWPAISFLLGFGTIVSGSSGIYDSAWKRTP